MTVSAFEPPPKIGTYKMPPLPRKGGNLEKYVMDIVKWLEPLQGKLIISEEDNRNIQSWLERYTKQVTDET